MKPQTRTQYARRMDPVLRWLASNPDAAPDLYLLADLACLSPYHFHRVYRAMMGESVNATVQRIRMHRAAVVLGGTGVPLRDVALRAGYASDAAFNRAFGATFGISPGRYRAARSRPFNPEELGMYPITIETFPGTVLAALPHHGSYQEIGPVFTRVFMLAAGRGLPAPMPSASASISTIPAGAGWPAAFDGGHAGRARRRPGDELERFEIPAIRCAMLTYTGPYNEMDKPYGWMFSEWLPRSGMEPADFPMFEQYLNDPRTTPPAQLQTRICLPLR